MAVTSDLLGLTRSAAALGGQGGLQPAFEQGGVAPESSACAGMQPTVDLT